MSQINQIETGALVSAQVTVAAAGTAVRLVGTNVALKWGVLIKALIGNTNDVYVGNVSGDVTAANGFELNAAEEVFLPVMNLFDVWLDADTNGEGVSILYG